MRGSGVAVYFSLRLWSYTVGARLQIALSVTLGLATAATGVARLAVLGWLVAQIFEGDEIGDLVGPIVAVGAISVVRARVQFVTGLIAYKRAAVVERAGSGGCLSPRLFFSHAPFYHDSTRESEIELYCR